MATSKEIGYADDPDAGGYEWGCARVVETDGHFTIVEESGCSCSSPGDDCSGTVTVGPAATLGGLFDEMNVNMTDRAKKPSKTARVAFIDAIGRLNKETIEAASRALEL